MWKCNLHHHMQIVWIMVNPKTIGSSFHVRYATYTKRKIHIYMLVSIRIIYCIILFDSSYCVENPQNTGLMWSTQILALLPCYSSLFFSPHYTTSTQHHAKMCNTFKPLQPPSSCSPQLLLSPKQQRQWQGINVYRTKSTRMFVIHHPTNWSMQ